MSDQHLRRFEILAFIDGSVDDRDKAEMWTHLEHCTECTEVYDELVEVMRSMNDGSVRDHVEDDFGADFYDGLRLIEDDVERAERDSRDADALFVQLKQHSVDKWMEIVGANPQACTTALVQQLVGGAGLELDRNPDHALVLLQVAETVAFTLPEPDSLRSRGHVWKQRSNAYRMAARYSEAIDAARVAEELYAELREPDTNFEIGQARYALAATLTKMMHYVPALRMLDSARDLLEEYGESAPLAKVKMLEATIRLQQGDVIAAREALRALVPVEERLGQQLELGRARFNLAECNLRLGELDAAMEDAREAIEIFGSLGNTAEQTRCEWTLVMIRLSQGDATAMRDLAPIAMLYEQLGMPGEAGFVTLDMTELLLQNEEWTEAAFLARGLVKLFTEAGVTLASVNALHFLRAAVENREATPDTVRYIRTYIVADDPDRPFVPPLFNPT